MTEEKFNDELKYKAAMEMAKKLLDNRLLTHKEYMTFDTIMREKYTPILSELFSHKA